MRLRSLRADGLEILGRCLSVEGGVRPVVVEAMSEGIDEGLELVDAGGKVVAGIELVPPRALVAFDGAVELRPLGRQHEQGEALLLAGDLEVGSELGATVDLDSLDAERSLFDELVEQRAGTLRSRPRRDAPNGPFGDRIIGGEVLDGAIWPHVHEQRVDLHQRARLLRLEPSWQAAGMATEEAPPPVRCVAPQEV